MDMFGFILLGIFIIALYYLKIKDFYKFVIITSLVVKLFFNIGEMIDIKFMSIAYFEFCLYLLYLLSGYFLIKNGITKKQKQFMLFWTLFIIINNLLLILFPSSVETVSYPQYWFYFFKEGVSEIVSFNKYVLIYDFYLFFVPIVIFGIKNTFTKNEIVDLCSDLVKSMWYVLIGIVVFEILYKTAFGSEAFYVMRNNFFGVNVHTVSNIVRGGLTSMFGFSSEPSAQASTLFIVGLFTLIKSKTFKVDIFSLIGIFVLGLLTGSLIFMVYAILLVFILATKHRKMLFIFIKKYAIFIILVIVIGLILLVVSMRQLPILNYFSVRINSIVKILSGERTDYNSELTRIVSTFEMIKVFLNRPIFGAGIGTSYAFSAFFSYLSNTGIVGVIGYGYLIYDFVKPINNKWQFVAISLVMFIFLAIRGSIGNFVWQDFIYLFLLLFLFSNQKEIKEE